MESNSRFGDMISAGGLFLGWGDSLARYFALGAVRDSGLLTHRFAANPVLTGLANPAFERFGGLGADHAFFYRLSHKGYLYSKPINCQSVNPRF